MADGKAITAACRGGFDIGMMVPVMQKKAFAFREAFPVTVPVLFGYIAIGIPFGLILVKAGYPWFLAPFMSVLMYAGRNNFV